MRAQAVVWCTTVAALLGLGATAQGTTPAQRREAFLKRVPAWRVEPREQVRRQILSEAHRDRWKWPMLLDSTDPALVKRGNVGLRDTKRDILTAPDFLLAEKLYGDRLEPATHEHIRASLRKVLADPKGWPYCWPSWLMHPEKVKQPWGSQYYYAAMTGVLGGEVLGDAKLFQAGRTLLRTLVVTRNRDGEDGEYNSPNYTTFGMTHLAILADHADDPECRSLARWLFARRLLVQLSRYHPHVQQVGAPYARGYAPDQFGAGAIHLALNDTVIPGGVVHDIALARRYDGGYTSSRQRWWLCTWHVPDYVRRIATDKPFPYQVLSTSHDVGWNWRRSDGQRRVFRAGMRRHTTYLTPAYVLGTSRDLYLYQPSGDHFMAQWSVRRPPRTLADVRVLWSWYARDDKGPFQKVLVMRRGGIFRTLQHRNKVLALYQPKDLAEPLSTDALKLVFMLTALGPVQELWVGSQRVATDKLPCTFAQPTPIYLNDGSVYAAILPLGVSDLGRPFAMRLSMDKHRFVEMAYYNYKGERREFGWDELPRIRNGFAFEIAAKGDHASFAAFRAHVARATVTDRMDGRVRKATFTSGPDTLTLDYNPFTETVLTCQANGRDTGHRWFHSTNAVQSDAPKLTVGRATLTHTNGVALWLLKDPGGEHYAVWNLSGRTVAFTLTTPAGTVRAERFGMGRLLLRTATPPVLAVEQLPGATPTLTPSPGIRLQQQ